MKPLFYTLLTSLVMLLVGRNLSAQNLSNKKDIKKSLEKEIAYINKQIAENSKNNKSANIELSLIKKKVDLRKKLIQESQKRLNLLAKDISLSKQEEKRLQNNYDSLLENYKRIIHLAYKTRQSQVWFLNILSSESLSQAFRRTSYLRAINDNIQNKTEKLLLAADSLKSRKDSLHRLQTRAKKAGDSHKKELKQLKQEENKAKYLINKLQKDRKQYLKELKNKKQEIYRLNKEIERLIRLAKAGDKKAKTSTKKSSTSIDSRLDQEFAKNKGKLPWPCEGTVIESFGERYHPVFKNVKLPFNNGITILMSKDKEVFSIFEGIVKQIVIIPGYNQCVLVQHGNYFSFYCKLAKVSVKSGEKVRISQKIGEAETIDGNSQLHFQIWKGSKASNPESWLK